MSLDDLNLDGVRLAVLDVDHTLVDGSTAFWFGVYLARRRQMPWTMLVRGAWWGVKHRTGYIDVETVMQGSAVHLGGMSGELIDRMTEEAFEQHIRPRIFPQARELVERCHELGIATLLLSASGDPMVRHVARDLGIPDHIGNKLEMNDGIATGRLLQPYAYGVGKLDALEMYLADRAFDISECAGFADSRSDLPLLRELGFPHAVNPDRGLRREAEENAWPILDLV